MTARAALSAYATLARMRKSLGLKQTQVAARIGITATQFSRVENGHDTVTADQLFAWASAVGCTVRVTRNDLDLDPAR